MMVDEQDAPTPHHLNIMDKNGGRYSLFVSNGSADPLIDENRIAPEIEAAQTIFLSLSAYSRKILHLLKSTQAEILLDLHDYDGVNPWYDDFIAQADVVQLSDVALRAPDPVISRLLAGRAHQVVLTKAAKGAEIVTARDRIAIPALPAEMLDSNGAGDAFSVALWYAQQSGFSLEHAGRFAAAAAAYAIESPMLFPENITAAQIEERALIG